MTNGAVHTNKGRLSIVNAQFVFGLGPKTENNIAYLNESIEYAKSQVVRFLERDQTFFESTIVSVKKSEFIEALPRLREYFELLRTELELLMGPMN